MRCCREKGNCECALAKDELPNPLRRTLSRRNKTGGAISRHKRTGEPYGENTINEFHSSARGNRKLNNSGRQFLFVWKFERLQVSMLLVKGSTVSRSGSPGKYVHHSPRCFPGLYDINWIRFYVCHIYVTSGSGKKRLCHIYVANELSTYEPASTRVGEFGPHDTNINVNQYHQFHFCGVAIGARGYRTRKHT
ncbi:hypothetical protein AVEN_67801-1 [Araneus ventricosus]|uniref:Uncharacterized protein n=1 Tax=Araneus ventricosus TaxID=182803 RepID=A0A4Y2J7A9_ARAVE|nr:hypothetical protein AVEN_67801-1 [Araneus ventricosus]